MPEQKDVNVQPAKKKHPLFTVFLLLASVYLVTELARSGYSFGQWLHHVTH